jgi:hypothetical protein
MVWYTGEWSEDGEVISFEKVMILGVVVMSIGRRQRKGKRVVGALTFLKEDNHHTKPRPPNLYGSPAPTLVSVW